MAFALNEILLLDLLWLAGFYAILAMSLNLVVGYGGLFQLGHVGFVAIGAVATTFLTHPDHAGLDFPTGALVGVAVSLAVAYLLGTATLRLAGDYFAIATLGFAVIIEVTFTAFYLATIPNVPPIIFFGATFPQEITLLGYPLRYAHFEVLFVLALAALTYLIVSRLTRSPYGRILRGQKEDDLAARSLGKNTQALRLSAYLAAAALASLAGSLDAHHVTVLDPKAYDVGAMILLLVIVILGGLGSTLGALLGAFLFVALDYLALQVSVLLDERTPLDLNWSALRVMLFAALLIALMIRRPQGLLGDRDVGLRESARTLHRKLRRWRRGPA